jgi:LacI family transcriptional regulator
MKKRVALKDVANRVGVSTTLVSYVLNNRMGNRINPETAEKIRRAAEEMNYRPNQIAKSLKSNKTQTIGLIVADIANPFSSSIARVIEDEAKKNHFTVIFGSADENCSKAEGLVNVLLSRQVDGFIIAPPEGFEKQLLSLREEDVPFVLIDRYFKDMEVNSVTVDNFTTSFNAVKHLTDNGFRRIGFINYKTRLIHLNERTRGYHEALRAAGLPQQRGDLRLIEETRLETEIQGAMDALLDPRAPVDAIFFSSSNVAIEGLSYLRKKKIAIPDELGVVCFDETKAYDLFPCPITYIRQPLAGIGQTAVKMLLRDIGRRQPATRVVLETEMIVKESSYPNHLRRAGTKKKK